MPKSVITIENSIFNTNELDDFYIDGFSAYIKPVGLLLLCDSELIRYSKFKSRGGELMYIQTIG